MLRALRNDFKKYSWTLWLVIIAFFGGFVVTDMFQGERSSKTGLVYVNDELMVRGSEYQRTLLRTLENYKKQFKNSFNKSMINQMRLPDTILRQLINTAVIRTEAQKLDLSATDEELSQKIRTLPSFQVDGKFIGSDRYKQLLAHSQLKLDEFEAQMRDEVIQDKFRTLITGAMVIDSDTLKEEYKKEKDKAEIDYIRLKTDRIKENIDVADGDPEIQEYYDAHKNDFKSQEKRAGYVIAYKFDDYKKEAVVPEKEVYEVFKAKKADYILPGKTKVSRILLNYKPEQREDIYKKVQDLHKQLTPENFADQAKALSEDNRAKQGGDHGYQAWQQFTAQEKSMIKGLEQGQISTPIDTRSGFSIVFIPEKVEQKQQAFNEVKAKIRASLENTKLNGVVQQKLQKIRDKLAKAKDIKAKAAEMNITVIETELLTSGKPVKDVDAMGYISRQLFSMEEKDIQFPVNFIKGLAIVQLTKIEKPQPLPLEEVRDKVKVQVVNAKKLDMLMNDAGKFALELNQIGDDAKKKEEFLKKNNLTTDFATYKTGNRLGAMPMKEGLDDLIFSSPLKQFQDPIRFDSDIVIYYVKNKTITADADFEKERAEYYKQKVTQMKNSYFASYMSDRMKSYQVEINQKLYGEIKDWVLARFN
jgi:peptidyl-prolyl cis-trans isomerase D